MAGEDGKLANKRRIADHVYALRTSVRARFRRYARRVSALGKVERLASFLPSKTLPADP